MHFYLMDLVVKFDYNRSDVIRMFFFDRELHGKNNFE